jgi:Leucine-rich repeat (LRR) protein
VSVQVRTTNEEAFRWALANADVVEVVSQDIRDRIARIADTVHQLYTQTLPDKVRENIDYVLKEGIFSISIDVDEDTAYETYEELANRGKLSAVDNIGIAGDDICDLEDYLGNFINAKRLYVFAPQLKNLSWASRLVNIENLELTQMQIDDSSWMKTLKKLRRVYLIESSITDLSVLSEHENIWYLDISGTNVSDISFIDKYQKLDFLNIVNCPIEDYSPLFTMQSRLRCLEIDERSLEAIGEERIRKHHLGIDIISRKNSPFWRALI